MPVFVKLAVNGNTPARITNSPPRTTMRAICTYDISRAIKPKMRVPITPTPGDTVVVSASMPPRFVPKHDESPTADTSQSVEFSRIHTENASAAITARVITARPVPDTTMRVMRD